MFFSKFRESYSRYAPFIGEAASSEKSRRTPETYLTGFGCQFFFLCSSTFRISSSGIGFPAIHTISNRRSGPLRRIRSPSPTSAIRPPAWASGLQCPITGPLRLSFMINGAYYDVDQGVEPDYVIRTYDHLYDREALTDYINSLF